MKADRNAGSRNRVKQEMSSLFKQKRPQTVKNCPWRHNFFGLAYTDQERSPTCEADKEELYKAGLGEK